MNPQARWIALLTLTLASSLQAFTDTNFDMKERAADHAARLAERPAPMPVPTRRVWVPASAKALDSFKPVFTDAPAEAGATRLAEAVSRSRLR